MKTLFYWHAQVIMHIHGRLSQPAQNTILYDNHREKKDIQYQTDITLARVKDVQMPGNSVATPSLVRTALDDESDLLAK